jgi:hypothetical protein
MTTAMTTQPTAASVERVLIGGDLSKLSEAERLGYYKTVCESLGLNPLTQPFKYINLSGKLTLYATKDATEQLRKLHGVSIEKLEKELRDDLYIVTAYARDASGRMDASTGVVPLGNLKGENLANALMKGETKAKRRVTLSICGLGMLDETEIESIPHAAEPKPTQGALPAQPPDGFADWLLDLESVSDNGTEALKQAWSQSPFAMRSYLLATNRAAWEGPEGLKAKAAKVGEAVAQ